MSQLQYVLPEYRPHVPCPVLYPDAWHGAWHREGAQCLSAQCLDSHPVLPQVLRTLSPCFSISLLLVLHFHFQVTSHLREEGRPKTHSSFLGKGGNDATGLGPVRLEQGSGVRPPKSGSASWPGLPPSYAFAHCLPPAWIDCPCHTRPQRVTASS